MKGGPGSLACLSTRLHSTCGESDDKRLCGILYIWCLLRQWPLPSVTESVAPRIIRRERQRAGGGRAIGSTKIARVFINASLPDLSSVYSNGHGNRLRGKSNLLYIPRQCPPPAGNSGSRRRLEGRKEGDRDRRLLSPSHFTTLDRAANRNGGCSWRSELVRHLSNVVIICS